MPTIDPLNPTAPATGPGAKPAVPNGLGKDDFLKLLVAQLQHQDPLKPTGDQEFIGQMAQFSMLEQVSNLANATERMAKAIGIDQTVNLLGRTVTYKDAEGVTHTGKVEKVDVAGGNAVLTVDGKDGIDPGKVVEVR
jgi:flagellar basal-body rod modification protein FlgD